MDSFEPTEAKGSISSSSVIERMRCGFLLSHLHLLHILFVFLSITSDHQLNGLNILMYVPTLAYSHVSFNGKIAEALIEKGHTVTMLHTAIDDGVGNYKGSTAKMFRQEVGVPPGALLNTLWRNPGPFEDSNPLNPKILRKFLRLSGLFLNSCTVMSADEEMISSLSNQTFDVVTIEQYDFCGFGLFRKLKIPAIVWLSATGIHQVQPNVLGIPPPNSYVPDLFGPFTDEMSLLERAQNTLLSRVTHHLFQLLSLRSINRIWRGHGVFDERGAVETAQSVSTVLVNSVPSFDFSAPTLSHFHWIGGFTVESTPPPLTKEWEEIAERKPFVLLTFGSIAKTSEMPSRLQSAFFEGFQQFPDFNFIVKYENMNTSIKMEADNLIFTKWIPQISLIAHRNYRAIITHGGWSSILESLMHGRPMILMPLFADHAKNSKIVEAKRVGLLVDKMSMDKEEFVEKLETILNDSRYRERCVQFAQHITHHSPLDDVATISYLVERAHREALRRSISCSTPTNSSSRFPFSDCYSPQSSHLWRRLGSPKIPREAWMPSGDLWHFPLLISFITGLLILSK